MPLKGAVRERHLLDHPPNRLVTMVKPQIRASLQWTDVERLLGAVAADHPRAVSGLREDLEREGVDALLDAPEVIHVVLHTPVQSMFDIPLATFLYVAVRAELRSVDLDDIELADYVASLLLQFVKTGSAESLEEASDRKFHYLVDMIEALDRVQKSDPALAYRIRIHMAEFTLWNTGIFHEHIRSRQGASGLRYYESMGRHSYADAAATTPARLEGMADIYRIAGDSFTPIRVALNEISDRYLFPNSGDAVERLLARSHDLFVSRRAS